MKDRPKGGRKRKISTEGEKEIIKKAIKGKDATEIAREYKRETGIQVDPTTVGRIISAHKLKWLPRHKVQELSEANEVKRLEYSRSISTHNLNSVLFSVE